MEAIKLYMVYIMGQIALQNRRKNEIYQQSGVNGHWSLALPAIQSGMISPTPQ